jgi:hypothetical protein
MGNVARPSDEADYQLLMAPGAFLDVRLMPAETGRPEVQLFGNRKGILSLANVFLWLAANTWRRELLSLAELPFVRLADSVSVYIRVEGCGQTNTHGRLVRTDNGQQLEWMIDEDDLKRLGLLVHHLASVPEHEYVCLQMESDSDAEVHIRMTDAAEWVQQIHA